jgi:hypothetical protein
VRERPRPSALPGCGLDDPGSDTFGCEPLGRKENPRRGSAGVGKGTGRCGWIAELCLCNPRPGSVRPGAWEGSGRGLPASEIWASLAGSTPGPMLTSAVPVARRTDPGCRLLCPGYSRALFCSSPFACRLYSGASRQVLLSGATAVPTAGREALHPSNADFDEACARGRARTPASAGRRPCNSYKSL